MTDAPFDLIVVGGGIHGTGIARDAARRGLRVVLVEKDDLASGTSSASSKLAHGGLRYLETFQFGLVREALRERSTLMQIAPHLVRPLPFLAVFGPGARWTPWQLRLGTGVYDLLAGGHRIEWSRRLDRAATLEAEPVLDRPHIEGAVRYHDAQVDDARLCVENAIDAAARGASILTRTRVDELLFDDGAVHGVVTVDREGRRTALESQVVVNAAGPWFDTIAGAQPLAHPSRVRLSRGTHVVVPPVTRGHALLLTDENGRVFFVLPWKGRSLIGTTEIDHTAGPDAVEPTEDEIASLLRSANAHLAGPPLQREQVLHAFAGVRALPPAEESDPGRIPRHAEIREDAPGLLGVFGGKYTTFRSVSERVVDAAERRIRGSNTPCTTATHTLPGGDSFSMNDYFAVAEDVLLERYPDLDVEILRYLVGTYGTRHTHILARVEEDPTSARRIEEGLPFTLAEVEHQVATEFARGVDDLVERRSYRATLGTFDDTARARWRDALERACKRTGIKPDPA